MSNLMNAKSGAYKEYESLIKTRDDSKKLAYQIQNAYIREFGELLIKTFEKQMECIRKKKMIEYAQKAMNHGLPVVQEELQKYLEAEMEGFQEDLNTLIMANKEAKEFVKLTDEQMKEIKKIYRRIAKRIHPDINSAARDDKVLMELWQRVVIAYKNNCLEELQEAEALIKAHLKENSSITPDEIILDIEQKIRNLKEEIRQIRSTKPFILVSLLEDETLKQEHRDSLTDDLKAYDEHKKELDKILEDLLKQGVTFIWQTN